MLTGQPSPLSIASQVLKLETILEINKSPSFNRYGFKILDRWAMNSPEKLKTLETSDLTLLMIRLLDQQKLERNLLESPEAQEQLRTGLAEHEILAMHEVNTEL